jgi:hypothetical protein
MCAGHRAHQGGPSGSRFQPACHPVAQSGPAGVWEVVLSLLVRCHNISPTSQTLHMMRDSLLRATRLPFLAELLRLLCILTWMGVAAMPLQCFAAWTTRCGWLCCSVSLYIFNFCCCAESFVETVLPPQRSTALNRPLPQNRRHAGTAQRVVCCADRCQELTLSQCQMSYESLLLPAPNLGRPSQSTRHSNHPNGDVLWA